MHSEKFPMPERGNQNKNLYNSIQLYPLQNAIAFNLYGIYLEQPLPVQECRWLVL